MLKGTKKSVNWNKKLVKDKKFFFFFFLSFVSYSEKQCFWVFSIQRSYNPLCFNVPSFADDTHLHNVEPCCLNIAPVKGHSDEPRKGGIKGPFSNPKFQIQRVKVGLIAKGLV